jgi:sodium pump decarboxylase gamma subunit
MTDTLSLSFQITVIGMSLVFGAIVLLWIMMAVLVRLTPDREAAEVPAAEASPIEAAASNRVRKQRAAAAAVAVAIAHDATPKLHESPLPATPIVSAWQAVQRSRRLSQHGPRQR